MQTCGLKLLNKFRNREKNYKKLCDLNDLT